MYHAVTVAVIVGPPEVVAVKVMLFPGFAHEPLPDVLGQFVAGPPAKFHV
jgi:hypothetical protein